MLGRPERHHVMVTHGLVEVEQYAGGGRVDDRSLDRIASKRPDDVERSPQADDGHLDRAAIVALAGRARTPDSGDHGLTLLRRSVGGGPRLRLTRKPQIPDPILHDAERSDPVR